MVFKKEKPLDLVEKARKLADNGDLDGAIKLLDKATEIDEKCAPAWKLKCQVFFGLDEQEKAIGAIKRYVELEPDDFGAYIGLASKLTEMGRSDEAETILLNRIKKTPEAAPFWYSLGVFYESIDAQKAKEAYEKTVALDPEHSDAWYNLASVLKKLEDDIGAVRALKSSIKINPDDPDAWDNLTQFLADLGQYSEAESAARKAVELAPDHPYAPARLAAVLMKLGKHEEAKAILEESTARDPNSPINFFNLGLVNELTGDKLAATRAYLIAEELGVSKVRAKQKSIRTTNCKKFNHPEIVFNFEDPIDEEWMSWLVDLFEQQVASGTVYKPEETVQMGWSFFKLKMDGDHLCLCEPHFVDMPIQWVNSITKSMVQMLAQSFVVESVELEEQSDAPSMMDVAFVCNRFGEDKTAFLLERGECDISIGPDSGWVIMCMFEDCDHHSPDSFHVASLYEVATVNGAVVKYLSLPEGSLVLDNGDPDDFQISLDDEVLELKPGSVLYEQQLRRQPIS